MAITQKQKFEKNLLQKSQELENQKEQGKNYFNIFDALGVGRKENYHSAFIRYLLDKDEEHYQKIFLKQFLTELKEEIPSLNFGNLSAENLVSIDNEVSTEKSKQNRRMDILMTFTNDIYIIIENKIGAKDQSAQIKFYVEEVHKRKNKLSDKQKYQTTLVIYLHPDEKDPSEVSFGKTSTRKQNYWYLDKDGQYAVIRDENDQIKAYYFQMSYKWIEDWVESCAKELEKQAKTKARGNSNTRGENELNKIIFGLNQYIEILKWDIARKRKKNDPVVEFITQDNKNQKMALEILENMQDTKHDLHKMLIDSWGKISERVAEKFYDDLLKEFEKGVKIGKDIYKADRTDDEIGKRGWQIVFYKKVREELDLDYVIAFGYDKSKFAMPYLAYGAWYYHSEKYDKIVNKCNDFFKDNRNKNGIKKAGGCYYKYILNEKDTQEYEFVKWIIKQNGNAVTDFKAKLTEFIQLETIQETMQQVEKCIS